MKKSGTVRFVGFVDRSRNGHVGIRIYPRYEAALKGVNEFSHLIIVYWLHLRDTLKDRATLRVVPRRHRGAPEMGVFGTRSPSRPNPIGLCVVKLKRVRGLSLQVEGLDAMKNTPIIDVKPYLPRADRRFKVKTPQWVNRNSPS